MSKPSLARQLAVWVGVITVFIIAGSLLMRAPSIDLGWKTPRAATEYRQSINATMHAATVNGAIHSVDPNRGIMRIDPSIWERQDETMRKSLIRLSSRYFKLQGRAPTVTVKSAYSNRTLAHYDGAGKFTINDANNDRVSQAPRSD